MSFPQRLRHSRRRALADGPTTRRLGIALLVSLFAACPTLVRAQIRPTEPAPGPPTEPTPAPPTQPAPAPEPAAPPAADVPAEAAPAPPPPSAEAPPSRVLTIGKVTVAGSSDPPGRLEGLIQRLAPPGAFFVEPGPADESGTPLSTEGRLRATLGRLGYNLTFTTRPAGSGIVDLYLQLRAADRIRQIYILGNWPLRQEDILRSLTLRPGQALPDPGPARDSRLERERQSVLNFMHDRGYLQAQVKFELRTKPVVPTPIELVVIIDHGPGFPIDPIVVEGANAISPGEAADVFRHSFFWTWPLPFDRQRLIQDVRTLTRNYRRLGYAQASVRHDFSPVRSVDFARQRVRLHLNIIERKRVEISFEGNREMSDSDLRAVLTIFDRGRYSNGEVQLSAEAIEQLYRSKGHLFVKVTWRADGSAPDVHRVQFTVNEGPSLKVRDVAFVGNQAFTADRLTDVVTVREFPFLGFLGIGEGGYASLRQLELDVQRLEAFYATSGYPGSTVRCEITANLGRPYVPLGPIRADDPSFVDPKGLFVRFVIGEAPRIDVTAIRFEVAEGRQLPRDPAFLLESLDGKVGQPYRPEVVRSDAERLRRLLGDTGHPEATVEFTPVDSGAKAKELVYQIRLGPPERVGPLFLRGNFFTSEGTIRRWAQLSEGEPLTTSALERGRRNLSLVQIFNNPSISLLDEAATEGEVPLLIEVEERHDHLGVVKVGGGASTEQAEPGAFPLGAYGAIGYEHRNLFGQSWILLSRAEIGRSLARITSEFTDPRFLATLFRFHLSGSYLSQATVRLGDIRSGGGTVAFAREVLPGVDLSLRYSLRSTVRTEFFLRGAGADLEQETVPLTTVVGAFGLGLEWQRLDSPLVPTRGFRLQAGVELAHPKFSLRRGEDTFVKASVRILNVIPLSRRVSLRHSVRYDQGFPLGGASLLPKVERFFAGGDTTLRGYELDHARTDDVAAESIAGLPFVQHRPLGGSLRILNNMDLQIQILGPWFGAVFIDNGVVADAFAGLSPAAFRHGAGIAPLVVKLPIGDLSIAWAWPLDPRPGDSTAGRLHFNIGLMF